MEKNGKALPPPRPGCSLILEDWMFELEDAHGKRLTDTALHLYALIYGFSKHKAGIYYGTSSYTQARLRASASAIKSAFRSLKDARLIANVEAPSEYGGQRRGWSITSPCDDEKRTSVGGQNPTPSEPDSDAASEPIPGTDNRPNGKPQVSAPEGEGPDGTPSQSDHNDDEKRTSVGGQNLTPRGLNLAPEGRNLTPEGPESDLGSPASPQVAAENQASETKGNGKPNQKPEYEHLPPTPSGSAAKRASEEALEGARMLMAESLNTTTPLAAVASCIEACFAKGYAIDDILAGYRAYLSAYKAEHDSPRYVMRLDTFLASPKGLSYYARPSQARNLPKPKPPRSAWMEDLRREAQAKARQENPDYAAMWEELCGLGGERIKLATARMDASEREAAEREIEERMGRIQFRIRVWEREHGLPLPEGVIGDAA